MIKSKSSGLKSCPSFNPLNLVQTNLSNIMISGNRTSFPKNFDIGQGIV